MNYRNIYQHRTFSHTHTHTQQKSFYEMSTCYGDNIGKMYHVAETTHNSDIIVLTNHDPYPIPLPFRIKFPPTPPSTHHPLYDTIHVCIPYLLNQNPHHYMFSTAGRSHSVFLLHPYSPDQQLSSLNQ